MTDDAMTTTAMDLPAFLKDMPESNEGMEHFKPTDIQIPRINIAQGLSPECTAGDPKKIDGLSMGELFNTLTREIYGTGPIEFFCVKAAPPRAVQFKPRKEGGGIIDRDVPLDDPRMEWGKDGATPIATLYYDYVIMLAASREIMGLSMKSTSIKTAKAFNSLMSIRKLPIWTGKYLLSVGMEKNSEGTYGVYQVINAGWATDEDQPELERLFKNFKTKTVELAEDEAEAENVEVEVDPGVKF